MDKQLDRAAELYTVLINKNPLLPEPRNNLAMIYLSQGDFDRASMVLIDALNTHPSYAAACENLNRIYKGIASAVVSARCFTPTYSSPKLDHETYRQNYSHPYFESYGRDLGSWGGHKRCQNRNKTQVKVEFDRLCVFRYPGEDNLMMMQFDQRYRSNDLDPDSAKEVY
ncbi:MAG: tetratricopeptide (TPR) repeat protein [Gammaproteobacteria bacterium]|jgi:tetratricopeptide (TPR) repeat protein